MKAYSGVTLKSIDDFKYLGSCIMDSAKDLKIKKALAWTACKKLNQFWSSNLDEDIKVNLFKTTVEPILLYGSETKQSEKHPLI